MPAPGLWNTLLLFFLPFISKPYHQNYKIFIKSCYQNEKGESFDWTFVLWTERGLIRVIEKLINTCVTTISELIQRNQQNNWFLEDGKSEQPLSQCIHPVVHHHYHRCMSVCLCGALWVWGLNMHIIEVEHSFVKHISTEPAVCRVPQRATQLPENRYVENWADTKQKRLNRTTKGGDGRERGLHL